MTTPDETVDTAITRLVAALAKVPPPPGAIEVGDWRTVYKCPVSVGFEREAVMGVWKDAGPWPRTIARLTVDQADTGRLNGWCIEVFHGCEEHPQYVYSAEAATELANALLAAAAQLGSPQAREGER
jgi:hypothetical protein